MKGEKINVSILLMDESNQILSQCLSNDYNYIVFDAQNDVEYSYTNKFVLPLTFTSYDIKLKMIVQDELTFTYEKIVILKNL